MTPTSTAEPPRKTDPRIEHDPTAGRFRLEVDGEEAKVSYRATGPDTWDVFSTYTPPALRGRGIAGRLVRHVLDSAREEGVRVVPSCWFVAEFVERNPDYQDVVVSR